MKLLGRLVRLQTISPVRSLSPALKANGSKVYVKAHPFNRARVKLEPLIWQAEQGRLVRKQVKLVKSTGRSNPFDTYSIV